MGMHTGEPTCKKDPITHRMDVSATNQQWFSINKVFWSNGK